MKLSLKKFNDDYSEPIEKLIKGKLIQIRDFTDTERVNYNKGKTLGSEKSIPPYRFSLHIFLITEIHRIGVYETPNGKTKTRLFEITTNYLGKAKSVKEIDDMAKYQ